MSQNRINENRKNIIKKFLLKKIFNKFGKFLSSQNIPIEDLKRKKKKKIVLVEFNSYHSFIIVIYYILLSLREILNLKSSVFIIFIIKSEFKNILLKKFI